MKLFLYVFKDYLKFVFMTMFLCLFLFILFDFIHRTTNYFSEYKPSSDLVIKMYLYQIPIFAVQALPISSLISSVMTMVMLARTNEVSAMRAAGMGSVRIILPLAVGGMLLSISSLVIGEWVLPNAASKLHHIQEVQIERGNEFALATSVKWQRNDQSIVHFKEFDHSAKKMIGLDVIELTSDFRPSRTLSAKYAVYSDAGDIWDGKDVVITTFSPTGAIEHSEDRESVTLPLNFDPRTLTVDRRKPDEMSVKELFAAIDAGDRSGSDTLSHRVDLQVKMAYPFAAFVVSLIGLSFAFRSERTTETARSILLAFGIGISYWFILNSLKELGKRGDLHPIIAGWFANIMVLTLIMFKVWQSRKQA